MSGLEAFSMACNVMTVISFSLETIDLYRKIYESGCSDPKLANSAERIRKTSVQVDQVLNKQPQLGSAQRVMTTDAEKQLRDVAAECLRYSKEIEREIASTSPKKSGLPRALKSTVKTVWRKPRLDQLKSHLEASRKDMDTTINVQILEECIRSGKLNYDIYTTLTEDNQNFIQAYTRRSQVIEVLLKKVSLQITEQSSKIQKEFHARFDVMETSKHEHQAYDCLIQSLKYENMDERKNNIPSRHEKTFEWIFEGRESEKFGNDRVVGKETSGDTEKRHWRLSQAEEAKEKQREADFPDTGAAAQLLRNNPEIRHKRDVTDWDTDDLKEYIFETLRFAHRFYLILLDGLDELSDPHGGMDELLIFLDNLMQHDRVKLCISSRPERSFEEKFSSGRRLRMQDLVFNDILNYTVQFLERIGLTSNVPMKEAITTEILHKAEGVFIWVHLVLQSVRNGLQQYNETWEHIHERLLELPRDLMQLYREMWFRLGDNGDRYIKQAAFSDGSTDCKDVRENDNRSKSGLLGQISVQDMYLAMEKWDSDAALVDFTHKTAIDFLDSDEGEELFGEYMNSEEAVLSRWIKGAICLGCTPYFRKDTYCGISRILCRLRSEADFLSSRQSLFDLLSLLHQSAERIDDFSNPPFNFRSHTFFIYAAAYLGLFDYITDILDADRDDTVETANAALMGASGARLAPSPKERQSRYEFIRKCLQHGAQAQQKLPKPEILNTSESTLTAWRCFLLEEIMHNGEQPDERPDPGVEKVMESFINAGVLNETSHLRYLIEINEKGSAFIPNTQTIGFNTNDISYCYHYESLLLEVNDNFLVRQLSNMVTFQSEVILQAANQAVMRPVLARNRAETARNMDMFSCKLKSDEDMEGFREPLQLLLITGQLAQPHHKGVVIELSAPSTASTPHIRS
ncbi:hypothetical protein CKAH01_15795 [Colletotrichum kahawae]|uniref:NACHT domain-containing protein n=1 Tax=Colletotrichum kahawae TaxID=34407 RepID=A0AAD9YJE2_COLKA|nr:hypothetical protein CKAH01_15795 [Colletotrichum kahawae]